MYQHIMVPLDGSNLAEVALPWAKELAKRCGTEEVTLVRVIKRTKGYKRVTDYSKQPDSALVAEPIGGEEKQAEKYLSGIAKKLQGEGIKVREKVLLGKPAQAIIFYAQHNPCDLIVMASHGRSGLSRWVRSSVAQRVFRASLTPILMVRGPGSMPGI